MRVAQRPLRSLVAGGADKAQPDAHRRDIGEVTARLRGDADDEETGHRGAGERVQRVDRSRPCPSSRGGGSDLPSTPPATPPTDSPASPAEPGGSWPPPPPRSARARLPHR